ncbi:TetR/AcrR family transcriptional regulator [Skermania sp. ID1734]|uniref:TetR/AcrR family transcriptional regulator n=1 Tax=Skermania sp. ID1734 TaxID=2597516 RepID=UPI0011803057|nr:TetR/AcrR family transcriptional regulator [Skermania sp. ID1734]TSD99520.1 TetR/AcrR family transcriptional regulator [Skermania sp. ID1734]
MSERGVMSGRASSQDKQDGRKKRWREHKIARREELVDGAIAAIRARGSNAGMDEIASEIGVSKTVLYRYFTDKGDLTMAIMSRYVDTVIAPRIYNAIAEQRTEYELTRSTIAAYVEVVGTDPNVYIYVMNHAGSNNAVVADSERMFAELVAVVLRSRASEFGLASEGAEPWAYSIVGAVQLATHWWISNRSMSSEDLINYLTMMVWSAIEGIGRVGGSAERFNEQPHAFPVVADDSYPAVAGD